MDIKSISDKYRDYVVEKRRYFHMNPEPSFCEFNTSKVVQSELNRLGIEYEVVCDVAVVARIKGKNDGKKILLRADMDALEVVEKNDVVYKSQKEGLMHACGHDGHTAMLLGAAHILNEVKDYFDGEVILFFQHAEEVAKGAKEVLDNYPLLDGVEGAFGIHLWQGVESGKISLESGPRMAAADFFKIIIEGKSGHGSMPSDTIDAVVVASSIVMNLQHLVSRNTNPLDSLVVTIGKMEAGTRFNVIAGEAVLEGTSRSFSDEVWKSIPEKLERVIKGTCDAYGAKGVLEMDRATPPLVNDEKMSEILRNSAIKLYGEESIVKYEKTTGGEDFAYISQRVPSVFAFVGIRNDEKCINAAHHNDRFDIDEDSLQIGMNLYAQFAIDFLSK